MVLFKVLHFTIFIEFAIFCPFFEACKKAVVRRKTLFLCLTVAHGCLLTVQLKSGRFATS